MTRQNTNLGIALMIVTTMIFALQDGITRHLTMRYPVQMVVMLRFWFIAAFVIWVSARKPGGLRAAIRTTQAPLHMLRGVLVVFQICLTGAAFARIGLIESHALLASYPLMVAALSGPMLGEKVGWRRWSAILVGFAGVVIMLRPSTAVLSFWSVLPLFAALLFAIYALLTRYVSRKDSAEVSFFWMGTVGAVGISVVGLPVWTAMTGPDWGWMLLLAMLSCAGHFCLIRAYALAEISVVQPFAYLQLVFVALLGLFLYDETLRPAVIAGSALVVAAGLFTLWRQWVRSRADTAAQNAP